MNERVDLGELFGDYLSETHNAKWEGVKSQVRLGDSVSGEVVARYPFGVFLDLGVGFPALLEVIQFERAGVFRYTMETYPKVGSTVTATIVWFDDRQRQIKLTQRADRCAPG